MIKITIYQTPSCDISGFTCSGHAGYAAYGSDIVCASVSVLVINTINAIEKFTTCDFTCDAEEEGGDIDVAFPSGITEDVKLLLDTMILGLKEIQNDYGNDYIILDFEEV